MYVVLKVRERENIELLTNKESYFWLHEPEVAHGIYI